MCNRVVLLAESLSLQGALWGLSQPLWHRFISKRTAWHCADTSKMCVIINGFYLLFDMEVRGNVWVNVHRKPLAASESHLKNKQKKKTVVATV